MLNQLDSSSNPSSTTSSTPSSPAPFQQSNPPSATPPPNPSPKGHRDSRFNFPGEPQQHRSSYSVADEDVHTHTFCCSNKRPVYRCSVFLPLSVCDINTKTPVCFFCILFFGSFFKFKASTNLCSLPVLPVTLLPLFPAKAACYFQHRQQFIFPGELTAREPSCCVIIILPSPFHPPQRLFLPAAPSVLSACSALSGSWRLVQLSACVCMCVCACQQGRVA